MESTLPLNQNSAVQNRRNLPSQNSAPVQSRVPQKSSFDAFMADKGPVLAGLGTGAVTGFFAATPIAKYFVKREVDESFNAISQRAEDLKSLFFQDLPQKEYLKVVKRLQKDQLMVEEVAGVVVSKLPESLKIIGLNEEQSKLIMEKSVNPFVKYLKDVKFKKLTPDEIEKLRLDSKEGNKSIFLVLSKFLNVQGKNPDDTANLTRQKILKDLEMFGKKSQKAFNPIKDELIDRYVKATGKYKVIASILGGLSFAGIVAIVKPTPKNYRN